MGVVAETAVTLRFFSPDLDPDEVTRLLGSAPSASERRGDIRPSKSTTRIVAKQGMWRLKAERQRPGDLDAQINDLLSRLTDDLGAWRELTSRHNGDLFCGLFLQEGNEGISLEPRTTLAIGQRGLLIDFDIYSGDRDR